MPKPTPNKTPGSLFRIDLRRLILWMCLFFVFLALANSLHAAYQVQRGLLLQHSLDTTRAYAEKLAYATNSFLETSAQALAAAALDVTEYRLDPVATQNELDQLATFTDAFNAIIAVDSSGRIFAAKSDGTFVAGAELQAPQARGLLGAGTGTAISSAFKGPHGRWLTLIAQPIFSPEGRYAGFIGGAVHLQGGSALQDALAKLQYENGSYFYIVDETGTLVYHPQHELIGSSFKDVPPVPAVLSGKAGALRTSDAETSDAQTSYAETSNAGTGNAGTGNAGTSNAERSNTGSGGDQIVSYAPISFANWGIVAQRPTEVALSNIDGLFLRTLYYSLPVFMASLLAIWWLSRFIAYPLRELAEVAANLDSRDNFSRIRFIKGWYAEAAMIRKGLMRSFSAIGNRIRKLHLQGTTDPLTGIVNRRGLDMAIERLADAEQDVAVVMVDVDHFKDVNDKHGHLVGDEVLKAIAALIMAEARGEDVVARMGGEEFVILLPGTEADPARRFAERLRLSIEQTHFDSVGKLTVSLGVACYPAHGANPWETLALADAALYRAKAAGRNCVHLT